MKKFYLNGIKSSELECVRTLKESNWVVKSIFREGMYFYYHPIKGAGSVYIVEGWQSGNAADC